jgi:hypothetical protein
MKTISQMRWFTALSLRRQGSSILQVAWSWPQKHRNKDNHYISVKRRVLGTRAKHCKQLPASRERFVKNGQAGSDFYGERGARTYIGVWSGGYAPSGVQGQSPWSEGRSPPEADGILLTETSHFALNYIDELVILRHWTIYTDWHRSVINGLTRLDTGGGVNLPPDHFFDCHFQTVWDGRTKFGDFPNMSRAQSEWRR